MIRLRSQYLKTFLAVVLLLMTIRAVLPVFGKYYINNILQNNLENYSGSIQDFDLVLLLGKYRIEGLKIFKNEQPAKPLLYIKNLEVGIAWSQLFKGRVVAKLYCEKAQIQLIDSGDKKSQQFGNDEKTENWKQTLDSVIPLAIETLRISDSSVLFHIKNLKGFESISLTNVNGLVQNLVSIEENENKLSPFLLSADLNEHAPLKVEGGVSIVEDPIRYSVNFNLKGFQITTLNELMRFYIPLDLTSGILDVEAKANGDLLSGASQIDIMANKIDVIANDQKFAGAKHFFIEIGAGFVNWIIDIIAGDKFKVRVDLFLKDGNVEFKTKDIDLKSAE